MKTKLLQEQWRFNWTSWDDGVNLDLSCLNFSTVYCGLAQGEEISLPEVPVEPVPEVPEAAAAGKSEKKPGRELLEA